MSDSVTVRAKFWCNKVEKTKEGSDATGGVRFLWSYVFTAVYSDSDENKKFWRYTPSGTITLNSISSDLFEVGKEYYIDFTEAKNE